MDITKNKTIVTINGRLSFGLETSQFIGVRGVIKKTTALGSSYRDENQNDFVQFLAKVYTKEWQPYVENALAYKDSIHNYKSLTIIIANLHRNNVVINKKFLTILKEFFDKSANDYFDNYQFDIVARATANETFYQSYKDRVFFERERTKLTKLNTELREHFGDTNESYLAYQISENLIHTTDTLYILLKKYYNEKFIKSIYNYCIHQRWYERISIFSGSSISSCAWLIYKYMTKVIDLKEEIVLDNFPFNMYLIKQAWECKQFIATHDTRLTLLWKNRDYICLPLLVNEDFIRESQQQSNCVRGYFRDVMNGDKFIVSIRKQDNINNSWITVEIAKSGRIVQARTEQSHGYDNSSNVLNNRYDDYEHLVITEYQQFLNTIF